MFELRLISPPLSAFFTKFRFNSLAERVSRYRRFIGQHRKIRTDKKNTARKRNDTPRLSGVLRVFQALIRGWKVKKLTMKITNGDEREVTDPCVAGNSWIK